MKGIFKACLETVGNSIQILSQNSFKLLFFKNETQVGDSNSNFFKSNIQIESSPKIY